MATIQKRKKKDKTYSYRVMIRAQDGHPKISKTFPTFQEAKEWASQEEARRRLETYFPEKAKKKRVLEELIDLYLQLLPHTQHKSLRDINRHLSWWKSKIGKMVLNEISAELISKYRKELLEGLTPKGTKRTGSTVNRYMASLSAVFTYGIKECGWIVENPVFRVRKLKESKGRDRILSPEEFERLLHACKQSKNPYLVTILLIAVTTGARRGEILALNWNDIVFDKKLICIKDSKNGRPRSIPIAEEVEVYLQDHFNKHNPHIPFVFPSQKRFGQICIRKAFDEALKRAEISNFRFHDLRHTFATYSNKEEGASNMELMTAMGHSSPQMTRRYTHLDITYTKKLTNSVIKHLIRKNDAKK